MTFYQPHDVVPAANHQATAAPHWLHDLLVTVLIGATFTGIALLQCHFTWLYR